MRKFMVGKYVGGCVKAKGQLLIDLTNCIHILQCLKCRFRFFRRSLISGLHSEPSLLKVCNTSTRFTSPVSSVDGYLLNDILVTL